MGGRGNPKNFRVGGKLCNALVNVKHRTPNPGSAGNLAVKILVFDCRCVPGDRELGRYLLLRQAMQGYVVNILRG